MSVLPDQFLTRRFQSAGAFTTNPVDPRRRKVENFGFLSGGGLDNFVQPEQAGNINTLIRLFSQAGLQIPFAGTTGIPAVNFRSQGSIPRGPVPPQLPSPLGTAFPAVQPPGASAPATPVNPGTPSITSPVAQIGGPATTQALARLSSPPPQTGARS